VISPIEIAYQRSRSSRRVQFLIKINFKSRLGQQFTTEALSGTEFALSVLLFISPVGEVTEVACGVDVGVAGAEAGPDWTGGVLGTNRLLSLAWDDSLGRVCCMNIRT
jgi:hypothetical protein